MSSIKLAKIILLFFIIFIGNFVYAENVFLLVTNMKTSESKTYTLGKQMQIPIKDLKGWKNCFANEPKSKYIKESQTHIRQHSVLCSADSGVSVQLVCTLTDEKNDFESESLTLWSSDDNQKDSRYFLHLSCKK